MWNNLLNPFINPHQSDSENSYQSVEEENEVGPELVSPRRPHQSPTASPRALLVPDPPEVAEVLAEAGRQLRNLPDRVRRREEAARVANMPEPEVVNFEDENQRDEAQAMQNAFRHLEKFNWDPNDLKFTFQKLEIKMSAVGVRKQYTKFQVLSTIIPKVVEDEVKELLTKKETEYPENNAYKLLKSKIIKIFGPKPEEAVSRALGRVLTGLPSQLARALVNDLCKHDLQCDCCPDIILTIWKRQLPGYVCAGIAHCTFSKATFDSVVSLADNIYTSNRPNPAVAAYSVAAVSSGSGTVGGGAVSPSYLNETQPGLTYPVPEVNAVSRGGRGGRGFRGGRGGRGGGRGGRGGQQQSSGASAPKHKGTKHPDLPEGDWQGCSMHFRHGKNAYFCSEPTTCPWKNVFIPKPQK